MSPSTDHPPSSDPAAARGRYRLLDECREIVVLRLAEVVHEALDKMNEHLADEAVQCGSADQRQALLEALSVVREHRIEIETRFRRSFNEVFERRMFAAERPEPAAQPVRELSLVSDVEIDERIEVDRLAHRARARLDPDEVLGIRARLGALIERDWFDESAHPASPQAVFEALKSALAEVAPRHEVKRALLDAFEPHVSANLNHIYVTLNERLVASRILPRIRQVPLVSPSGLQTPGAGGAGTATDAAGGRPQAGPPASVTRAADAGSALEAVLQRLAQGQQSARLSAARMLSDPDMFGVADLPLPAVDAPLLDALSSLQARAATPVPGDSDVALSGTRLFQLLGEQAHEQGSPLDQITVEIVSIVFDYIHGDRRLPDAIKHQLMRMQVVAVKAALIDRSFFARRQHPMRRLIDRISEIGADPDAQLEADSPLLVGLSQVIDRIVSDFDRDLSVFEQALERIERLMHEESERRAQWLAAQTVQAERDERLAVARDEARAQVALRLTADAPAFVHDFLSTRWVDVLAVAHAGGEQTGRAWDEALRVVEDLLWSVAPKAPQEVVQLAQLLPKLIGALMRGVKTIDFPEAERQAFFDALLSAHTQAIAAAKAVPVGHPPQAAGRRSAPSGTLPMAEPSGSDLAVLDPLKRGDRVEMIDDDGEPQRYKLAWISPTRKLFILSRYPQEARSIGCDELAGLFERHRARLVPPEASVLDRAIGAAAHDAHPAVARHAST